MLSKLNRFLTVITLSILLSVSFAIPVSAAGCGFPSGYPAYKTYKIAESGDFKSENGNLYICINGNWQYYSLAVNEPNPVNGRVLAEVNATLLGDGKNWVVAEEKQAFAAQMQDPNFRTAGDTIGAFYYTEQTTVDGVTGETSTSSDRTIRLSGRNATPGATYYAFATKTMWDQTSEDGWNVQTGEAKQMRNIDGSYTSVVATAEGTASLVVNPPAAWEGWAYVRLVSSGGGKCLPPIGL